MDKSKANAPLRTPACSSSTCSSSFSFSFSAASSKEAMILSRESPVARTAHDGASLARGDARTAYRGAGRSTTEEADKVRHDIRVAGGKAALLQKRAAVESKRSNPNRNTIVRRLSGRSDERVEEGATAEGVPYDRSESLGEVDGGEGSTADEGILSKPREVHLDEGYYDAERAILSSKKRTTSSAASPILALSRRVVVLSSAARSARRQTRGTRTSGLASRSGREQCRRSRSRPAGEDAGGGGVDNAGNVEVDWAGSLR